MIKATGIVRFYSRDISTAQNEIYLHDSNVKIEVISCSEPFIYQEKPCIEVKANFIILLERKPYCKSLEDYAGFVFPFMRSKLPVVLSTQTVDFEYVPEYRTLKRPSN
ncbi:hypothetical protein [Jeotgalibacillus soli]|uniref:Uncharacterized protein n=1 Tax=Jeotgalibacillus soli TaxID=889306 RepID=A0A0C2VM20_9BACL|nr:hypothetical protein [Jeotgalibacillus soli]KIL45033.1 hypothetical protein KP78_25770 [Jeotgalibacillus soli]